MPAHVPVPDSPFPDTPEGRALSRWLDGEATPDERRAVEARLASDPALAAEVARLRADLDAWREASRLPAPERLAERVLATVAAGDLETERFRAVARRTAIAASALLALGVGGSVWTHHVSPPAGASPPPLADLAELRAASERYLLVDPPPPLEGR